MKLLRFASFLESNLITESLLHFSEDFKDLLGRVYSPIGRYLIEIERVEDKPFVTNYIDLSDDKEHLLAVLDKKAQSKMTRDGFTETDMFSQDKMGNLRQKIRAGKIIRQILSTVGGNFTENEINDFVDQFRQAWDEKYLFKEEEQEEDKFANLRVVKGEEIKKWYLIDNYSQVDGTLGRSCMRYPKCQYYLGIYTENPDVCSMLILLDETGQKIRGRALVWELHSPKVTYMDRQYTINNDEDVTIMRMYAKSKGWYYRSENTTGITTDMISPNGELVDEGDLEVYLSKYEFDYYPYVDTLQYFDYNKGKLTTQRDRNYYELDNTDGTGGPGCNFCGGEEIVDCPECGGGGTETCSYCDGDGQIECRHCDGEGDVECDTCSGEGELECSTCDGEGNLECDECSGEGQVECSSCDGSGQDEEGDECSDCGGKGKVDCDECDAKGNLDCDDCNAKGKIECEDCGGAGKFECAYCDGDGERECGDCSGLGEWDCHFCGGDGRTDCPECQ
jgi:hypothetical protein